MTTASYSDAVPHGCRRTIVGCLTFLCDEMATSSALLISPFTLSSAALTTLQTWRPRIASTSRPLERRRTTGSNRYIEYMDQPEIEPRTGRPKHFEQVAFERWLDANPNGTTLLLDTIDVYMGAVHAAMAATSTEARRGAHSRVSVLIPETLRSWANGACVSSKRTAFTV